MGGHLNKRETSLPLPKFIIFSPIYANRNMLQTKNLAFSYDENVCFQFPDFSCQSAENCLLLGQSGSGKTTLLHLIGGMLTPREGSIIVNDQDITKLSAAQLDRFRGQNIGIVFQKSHFVRALNVEENLILAQQLADLRPDKTRIQALLDRLNIGHKLKAKTDTLSIGEQQRVAIARALVNQPTVILADEPTSALDDINCDEVIALLEEEARKVGSTLLVVTHDNRLKEKFLNKILLHSQQTA